MTRGKMALWAEKTNRVNRVSVNGSYILPSGIVVLVEEDVEAYFAGTLVFYEKENLPAAG